MRISGRTGLRALVATTAAATLLIGTAGTADAHDRRALTPRTHFTMAADGSSGATAGGAGIPNIDSVKSTIRAYYNATDGIADKESSPYVTEMKQIEDAQWGYLVNAFYDAVDAGKQPALVFDADDTTLMTYDMEDGAMHFNFDPALQDTWVQDERFPATPGMVTLVNRAARLGYTVFGLTGRNDDQKAATLGNLDKVGFTPFDDDTFFTKWTGAGDSQQPDYITCATAKCTTVEYKAGTRQHIENDLGYDIVLNVGDQWSDLQGGYADKTLKLPNPTYYLPSPNIAGAPAGDAALTPRTAFIMKPDGSSGLRQGGEGIPNIDSVKSTIRTYYYATDGIADKESSPYVTEMTKLTNRWATRVHHACTTVKRKHHRHPAVVFDADDTTLMTYDMEDGAMHFNYDPALQDEWVQDQRFPATPGMVKVVRAASQAGCRIVGLTGRNDNQKAATLGNLAMFYGALFKAKNYYTKWTGVGASQQPSYIHCATEKCTTIEYKSQTRKHLQKDLGMTIVANFGDQFSDLIGGHARTSYKLPNPTYYLP
jgi:predicted secreted acid phosphatase